MLFAPENLPYWMFLGLGGALFLVIVFGNKVRNAPPHTAHGPGDRVGRTGSPADIAPPIDGDLAHPVVPGKSRRPYSPFVLRLALNLTLWGLLGWMANVAVGIVQGVMPQNLLWVGLLAFSLIAALIISQPLMAPVGWVINSRRKTASFDYLVGCTGTVSSDALSMLVEAGTVAQVDVTDPMGSTLTVNAALPDWATITPQQGDRVTLIERSAEIQLYYVVAADSVDQDHWLKQTAAI